MNKIELKKALLKMHSGIVEEFESRINSVHSMVDIDESDVLDPEDFSHQYESGEFEQLLRTQLNRAKSNLSILENINFGDKNSIESGALVETGAFNFFIGLSTTPFSFDGRQVIGISKSSPFYTVLLGKKVGDNFSYCGNEYSIDAIY